MPRIDILEKDLTRATGAVGTDIPFIPGFVKETVKYFRKAEENETATHREAKSSEIEAAKTDSSIIITNGYIALAEGETIQSGLTGYVQADKTIYEEPVLCTSVTQFESIFGTDPFTFAADETFQGVSIKNNDVDRSYIMAKELLNMGMPVYYYGIKIDADKITKFEGILGYFYNKISTFFGQSDLKDKGEYTFKYLTTGGYPNYKVGSYDLHSKMQNICMLRGDAVAIIEGIHNKNCSVDPTNSTSFFNKLCSDNAFDNGGEFSTAFFPWAPYNLTKSYKNSNNKAISRAIMPACFGYLADLAANIKVSPNWLAMAGTTRGLVPNITGLDLNTRLSNVVANAYQPTKSIDGKRALNAITDIKPYGLCIWGNRTLKTIGEEGLTGTNFLNTRNMISDIKKVAYRVAKSLIYEQNNETLWLNFKSQVAPFLEQLKSGAGIADYKLLKLDTHYNGSSLGKEEFACAIRIIPVYAVESFEITVVVSDADVAVE